MRTLLFAAIVAPSIALAQTPPPAPPAVGHWVLVKHIHSIVVNYDEVIGVYPDANTCFGVLYAYPTDLFTKYTCELRQ
jgi:hypothetical protein